MFFMIGLFFLLFLAPISTTQPNCSCINGGICEPAYFSTPCVCPPLLIGKYCETQALQLEGGPRYLDLNLNFKHFVFSPTEGNFFKFTFNVCMVSNPEDLECLIFLTSDQQDGSPSYEPPIISSAKIKTKQGSCMSFSSPYIEIKKNIPQAFRRIIIGVRTLPKTFKSYFYRTVPGKFIEDVPGDVVRNQPQASEGAMQRIYYSVEYQHYKQTFMQTIVRKLIKVLIGAGVILALYLFCKIALFSYGIDTKDILLWIHRAIRSFCRRICPVKGDQRTYRNYLRYRASKGDEEMGLSGKDECAICLQQFMMEDLIEETACRHIYHENCLQEWQAKNEQCPLCRQKLKKSEGWVGQVLKV